MTSASIFVIQNCFCNFYQMLNEKTSSANNLRLQSSRRHEIRNLKAKVRSLLPEQICPKQSKRIMKNRRYEQMFKSTDNLGMSSQKLMKDKRLMKQLQKLSEKELEKISQNKYYFLGNERIIEQFDLLIRESHPKIKEHQWTSPNLQKTRDTPFGFIPPFFFQQKDKTNRPSFTSSIKRGSTGISVHLQKHQSIMPRVIKSECQNYKQFQNNFLQRKQAIQEQQKVKRQINSMHLQRQQHIAEVNRISLLQQKIQKAKVCNSTKFSKHRDQKDLKNVFQIYDVSSLAAKLRKICLKNYKKNQKL